jgi:ERCC4-type nuclease
VSVAPRTIAATTLHIYVDTREQTPPAFPEGVTCERYMLAEGDYSSPPLLNLARIERKNPSDFASSLTHDRERFDRELVRLRRFRHRLVIVEGDLSDFLSNRYSAAHPNSIVQSICAMYARFGVPTLFAHDAITCGRMIAGILRRLEEEHARPAARTAA